MKVEILGNANSTIVNFEHVKNNYGIYKFVDENSSHLISSIDGVVYLNVGQIVPIWTNESGGVGVWSHVWGKESRFRLALCASPVSVVISN